MRRALGYRIVIAWSDEEDCYVARVPAFGPGVTAYGEKPDAAAREARVAVELCIESLQADGKSLPTEDHADNSRVPYLIVEKNGEGTTQQAWRVVVRGTRGGRFPYLFFGLLAYCAILIEVVPEYVVDGAWFKLAVSPVVSAIVVVGFLMVAAIVHWLFYSSGAVAAPWIKTAIWIELICIAVGVAVFSRAYSRPDLTWMLISGVGTLGVFGLMLLTRRAA